MSSKLTLDVEGMSCGGCESNVVDAVGELPGVESVTADHTADEVAVEGDADEPQIREAIENVGYSVR